MNKSIIQTMANEGATLDFRKMVVDLLGLAPDAAEPAISESFNTCMTAEPDMTPEMKKKMDDLAASNAILLSKVNGLESQVANEKKSLTETEAKISGLTAEKTDADKKVIAAEAKFANERQARIKLIVANAIAAGKITGAEAEPTIKTLANATDFDGEIALLEKKTPKVNTTQQSVGLTKTFNSSSAANEISRKVNETMKANPGMDYTLAWKTFERTEEGKALHAQLHKPESSFNKK